MIRPPPQVSINDPDGVGDVERIEASRAAMGSWLRGAGIEVGGGSRPFPVPAGVSVEYGDIRGVEELTAMFGVSDVVGGVRRLDAQTLAGVESGSVDFVISAHVIEHLFDPVGAVEASSRVIRAGGLLMLTVPNMRHTFDHLRPETTLEHVMRDALDGGEGTRRQAYEEHVRYVHPVFCEPIPEEDVPMHREQILDAGMDIHVHAWTPEGFRRLLQACEVPFGLRVEAQVSVANETTFAVRKL